MSILPNRCIHLKYRLCRPAAQGFLLLAIMALGFLAIHAGLGRGQEKKQDLSDEKVAPRLGLTLWELEQLHDRFGQSNEMLLALPKKEMHMWYRKLARFNVQHDRENYTELMLQNEKGIIPDGAPLLAYSQMQGMFKNMKDGRLAGLPVGPGVDRKNLLPGLNPGKTSWDQLGPDHVGGRTRALVVHPTDHKIMYAGSASGGIWRSMNGGKSWEPLNDLLSNMAVCSLVLDPTDAKVLYLGTGEGYGNVDAIRGGGIYKTLDAGETWQALNLPKVPALKAAFQFVNRLAISSDGKVMLAAVGAVDHASTAGIYRSEAPFSDWSLVQKGYFGCVSFDPSDNTRASQDGQAFYSQNGGKTWAVADPTDIWTNRTGGSRTELAYARANPSIVYASVDNEGGQLWRSANGGKTYSRVKAKHRKDLTLSLLNQQGWYDNVVWAGHPTNPDLVIVGGVDLWKSSNGGKTFEEISDWQSTQSAHADQHIIVAHPDYGKKNNTVFFGNDGGVFRVDDLETLDKHKGWTSLSNGYVVTQFYGAAGHAKAGILVAGAQDNGTWKLNLSTDSKWEKVWGGDGGYCAIDQENPNFIYGEAVFGAIFRADKEGNVEFISGFREDGTKNSRLTRLPAPFNITEASNPEASNEPRNANFIAPFILDPNDQKRLLAGAASLWVTANARADKPAWQRLREPEKTERNYISAISVAKGNSDVIWIGYNGSNVYMTTNGTTAKPTWTRVDNGATPLPGRAVTRIIIDPKDHKRVYVTFAGYAKGNLWKTEDAGKTWLDLSRTLPEVPFYTLAVHPRNSNYVYLGTEIGVFGSDKAGDAWGPTNEGATSCRVNELFWMDETLVAATHGRGVFKINLGRALPGD
jgi:photosystem II stability/assembly factor-like uncharacterized protein